MSPRATSYALAIDLGTSGPKVGVVCEAGHVHGNAFRPVPTLHTPDGGAEHDPEAIWRAVVEATHAALRQSSAKAEEIDAVICDSHFFSLIPLRADGTPLMNLITWLDKRGARENLRRVGGGRGDNLWRQFQWWRIHGIPPLASGVDNISKIRWIQLAYPEVYEQAAVFLEPMDYLTYRLTGRFTANPCTVFPMQLTDNRDAHKVVYAARLLAYAGVDRDKLPELLPVDAVVGTVLPEVAAELGISPEAEVVTGLNDTQAGAVGCGAFRGGTAGVVLGSSGVVVSRAEKKKTDVRTGLFTLPSPVPGEYLMTGEGGVAGSALEHFLSALIFADDALGAPAAEDVYARLEAVVSASPPGSNGVLFLPWLNGSVAPVNDGAMRGGFLNVSLDTARSDLARAVLEGISYQYRLLADAARSLVRGDFDHFTLHGGGALSETWSQTIADMLGAPVQALAEPRLINCRGLGLLAFQRLGRIDYDTVASRVAVDRVYEPNPALASLYADRRDAMAMAFKRNRGLFRKLNGPSKGSQVDIETASEQERT